MWDTQRSLKPFNILGSTGPVLFPRGDAWALFTQLDREGDAEVNVDEFLEGCMLLKGSGTQVAGCGPGCGPRQPQNIYASISVLLAVHLSSPNATP